MAKQAPLMTPVLKHAEDITAEPMQWLWYPYIPKNMLVMLDGDPGIGKSMMLLQIATNLSKELPFLNQVGKPTLLPNVDGPQSTLMLSAEDSLEHVMIPRLTRAGADLTRITFLTGWLSPNGAEHTFDLQHLPVLEQAITDIKPVLVVLDPLVAYLGDIDMHRSNQTRPLMASLKSVAERHQCTILGIRHPSKLDQGGPLMYRGQGNMDIVGASRSALWVQKHPAHPETQSLMLHSKTNIGMPGRTVIFSREQGEFKWVGLTRLREEMFTGKGPDPYAFLEAFFWLEELMKPGVAYESAKLDDAAEKRHITHKILARAKKALGIRAKRDGDRWLSILSPLSPPPINTTRDTRDTQDTRDTRDTRDPSAISIIYDLTEQEDPDTLEDLEDQESLVSPVCPADIYECCGVTLAHNQRKCFQCGKARQAATI